MISADLRDIAQYLDMADAAEWLARPGMRAALAQRLRAAATDVAQLEAMAVPATARMDWAVPAEVPIGGNVVALRRS